MDQTTLPMDWGWDSEYNAMDQGCFYKAASQGSQSDPFAI